MNDFLKSKLFKFMKFSLSSLVGTVVDTLVLWLFSHFVFTRYVGQYIISPVISFECAVFANYLLSYFMVWKERVTNVSRRSFLCRYVEHFTYFRFTGRVPYSAGSAADKVIVSLIQVNMNKRREVEL